MPRKTTARDVGQAAEAIGRNAFRIAFHPAEDKRPKEKQLIHFDDLDNPKSGPEPTPKTAGVPDFWHKAYGAYAPRYQKQPMRKGGGKRVTK